MSKVTDKEKAKLLSEGGDSEGYHSVFDELLEEKLYKLDPKWMEEMKKLYKDSGCSRWCA